MTLMERYHVITVVEEQELGERQTPLGQLIFNAKVQVFRARRSLIDLRSPVRKWPREPVSFQGERIEIRSSLYTDERPEERAYELGKVVNLRTAVHYLNGIVIPAGETFSFWRQLGRATVRRGFVRGRMLQLGCVVPAIGGGLCQLSNALYELALQSGCEIVERHPHSARLPGSPLRDATVAWNYIDLRFRSKRRLRLDLKLSASELIAGFICEESVRSPSAFNFIASPLSATRNGRSGSVSLDTCATCNEVDCSRHETQTPSVDQAQAFLLDAFWPEFDCHVQQTRRPHDWLFIPLDGSRWNLAQYAWSTNGFDHVRTQSAEVLRRSIKLRRLATQGAPRQTQLLRSSERIASSMAARIPPNVSHIVVDQTMLPALWQSGVLGGRTFDVIMRRLPMRLLQARLDGVAAKWPQSPTAADFRVGEAFLDAEDEALSAANRIVTPHLEIASLFPTKTHLLEWVAQKATPFKRQTDGVIPRFFFPGPVTARKGAYVLREALKGLPVEVIWRGSELEGPNFWSGISNRRGLTDDMGIAAVVQPAFLEDRPRALLQAAASGIPVITTVASGLDPQDRIKLVRMGDVDHLRRAIEQLLDDHIRLPQNQTSEAATARR